MDHKTFPAPSKGIEPPTPTYYTGNSSSYEMEDIIQRPLSQQASTYHVQPQGTLQPQVTPYPPLTNQPKYDPQGVPIHFFKPRKELRKSQWIILTALLVVLIILAATVYPITQAVKGAHKKAAQEGAVLGSTIFVTGVETATIMMSEKTGMTIEASTTTSTSTTISVSISTVVSSTALLSSTTLLSTLPASTTVLTQTTTSISITTASPSASATGAPLLSEASIASCFGLVENICANTTSIPTNFAKAGFEGCNNIIEWFYCSILDQIQQEAVLIIPGASKLICTSLTEWCGQFSEGH